MPSRRVLVTGGVGFIGSAIVLSLQARHPDWTIAVFDLAEPALPIPNVTYLQGDVASAAETQEAVAEVRPSVVIHTAGTVPLQVDRYKRHNREAVFSVNVEGTQNMLQASRAAGVEAFVWTSSFCCLTDDLRFSYPHMDESWLSTSQLLVYGESKAAAEAIVLAANDEKLATCSLRPSVVFGENDYQLIPTIHSCIERYETPFIIGDGQNLWDITDVRNVAHAHVLAAENLTSSRTAAGQIFLISNHEPVAFRSLCLFIWSQFGHYPPFEVHIPQAVATAVGFLAEWIVQLTKTSANFTMGSVAEICAIRFGNGTRAQQVLGYKPIIGLEQGLRDSCLAYKKRLAQKTAIK